MFYHKYIPTVIWKATFKVVYHTKYSSYQYCFHIRILGTVLIHEVLLDTHICSSNSVSLFTRCICYSEGCLVVYSVLESDFVRRVDAYVCLCVINICESHKF